MEYSNVGNKNNLTDNNTIKKIMLFNISIFIHTIKRKKFYVSEYEPGPL